MNTVKRIAAAVLLATTTLAGAAHAEDTTYRGKDLLRECSADYRRSAGAAMQDGFCLGFILGVMSMQPTLFDVSAAQARELIVAYLQQHPEQRDVPANGIMMLAITLRPW